MIRISGYLLVELVQLAQLPPIQVLKIFCQLEANLRLLEFEK